MTTLKVHCAMFNNTFDIEPNIDYRWRAISNRKDHTVTLL